MAKNLLHHFSAGLSKAGLAAAFLLTTSLNGICQDLKTGQPENLTTTKTVKSTFEAFSAAKKGKTVIQNSALRIMAVKSLPLNSSIYNFNHTTNTWVLQATGRYTYDAQGNQTSFTRLPAISPGSPPSKDSTLYDAHGNQTFGAGYNFHAPSNAWIMQHGNKDMFTYNAAGKPIEVIEESFYNGIWEKFSRTTLTYNGSGFPIEELHYDWQNNSWVLEEKLVFSYTVASNPPSGILMQGYVNGNWVNMMQFTNVTWHDFEKGQHTNFEGQMWVGNAWVNALKSTVAYDSFGGSVIVDQEWNGTAWVNETRQTFTHDAKMNYISLLNEDWQNNAWVFMNKHEDVLTYNTADQITERISRSWDPTSNIMRDYSKEVYSNFLVMGTGKSLSLLPVKIYPNPAVDFIMVQLESPEKTTVTLADLTGKRILSQELYFQNIQRLNLAGLAQGTYLLKLENSKGKTVRKIVKN